MAGKEVNSLSNIERRIQEELCKIASSRFDGVNLMEITPFMAVMRMLKIEYGEDKPEVYKMLIAVLHDYNPYLDQAHYEKTIRYVNILLAKQPELAEYLVSIIPKPEDVSVRNKKGLKTEATNVPFSHAEELLKHSLHIIGSKGKGFDLRLPSDNNSRHEQDVDDTQMKVYKLYNFNPPTDAPVNHVQSLAKQKWTIQASTSNLPSQGVPTVVVKTEPVTSIGSGVDTASNNNSKVFHNQVRHKKPTVHDIIKAKLQVRQEELRQSTQSRYIQIKREPVGHTDTTRQQDTIDVSKSSRPVILRKPDLQGPCAGNKLPTAKIDKQTSLGNQLFPYTQEVVFSDGSKQNFVFNAKSSDDVSNQSETRTVIIPFSQSGLATSSTENGNPLVCLQQMVSETHDKSGVASKTNVVVLQDQKITSPGTEAQIDEATKTDGTKLQFRANSDATKSRATVGPIDLSIGKEWNTRQKRKRTATDN